MNVSDCGCVEDTAFTPWRNYTVNDANHSGKVILFHRPEYLLVGSGSFLTIFQINTLSIDNERRLLAQCSFPNGTYRFSNISFRISQKLLCLTAVDETTRCTIKALNKRYINITFNYQVPKRLGRGCKKNEEKRIVYFYVR